MENPDNETKSSQILEKTPTPETAKPPAPETAKPPVPETAKTPAPETAKAPVEVVPPKVKTETRGERFLRLSIRWLAGFLIVFGLGALAVIYLLFIPQREDLQSAKADFARANQQAGELQSEVTRLRSMENQNQAFQNEIEQRDLHISILTALADVQAARAALALGNTASVQSLLATTAQDLLDLKPRLSAEQQNAVVSMQDRLNLIKDEVGTNSSTAQSDLGLLADSLMQLEKANFGKP